MNAHSAPELERRSARECLRAELVTDTSRFESLEPAWLDLWRRCPAATPFQLPGWLIAWWRAFSPGPLAAAAVWRDEQLVGLAPCYFEESTRRLLPIGISVSDYLDVLLDPASPGAAAAIVETACAGAWARWEIEELRDGAAAWALPCPAGLVAESAAQSACPVLHLTGDLETSVPQPRLRQLRHDRARAGRRGLLHLERATDPTSFLDTLFDLHAKRWTSRGETGVLADNSVVRFHREALPSLMSEGLARCFLLWIGGTVAGAYYGFHAKGQSYYFIGGFDPDFARESPGSILIGHAVETAMDEGSTEFHFLRGQESYKYAWGAADRWNRRRAFSRRPA